jgi:CRP-like cAMP-binding protein
MQYELLNGASLDQVAQVLALGTRIRLTSGASLFRLGDTADSLFLTTSGRIRLTIPMQVRGHDEEVLVEEKLAGQTVGWSALIPPYRFTLSATASTETEVIQLRRTSLQTYFAASPEVGAMVCLNLAIVVGRRLQTMQAMWLREMQRTVEHFASTAVEPH